MLVVHGVWVDGSLGVWAEDTAQARASASRALLRRHPFAASTTTLAAVIDLIMGDSPEESLNGTLSELSGTTLPAVPGAARRAEATPQGAAPPTSGAPAVPGAPAITGGTAGAADSGSALLLPGITGITGAVEARELTVLLPGSAAGPLPSPESGLASRARRPRISAWRIPSLLFQPADALRLLGSLPAPAPGTAAPATAGLAFEDGGDDAPAWEPALSLRYLAVVAEHARGLARRGRILPQLVVEDGVHAARWRPVLTGADLSVLPGLAAAMPPICRAAGRERPPAEVLEELLNGLVDGAARLSLPGRLILGSRPGARTALADRWLYALTGEDALLPGARPAEAAVLGEALTGWLGSAHELEGPVRVCFRLIEPAEDEDTWRIEFGLSPAEDTDGTTGTGAMNNTGDTGDARDTGTVNDTDGTSGMGGMGGARYLPAERIRAGERAPWLPERPEEVLRAGLVRAVRLHPGLHTALRAPLPTGLTVETAWAFSFLRHGAPVLRAAGYEVRLPAWAGRQGLGLKLTTRPLAGEPLAGGRARPGHEGSGQEGSGREESARESPAREEPAHEAPGPEEPGPAASGRGGSDHTETGLDDRVNVRLDVTVGDHTIDAAELAELAELRVPLVRLRGRWVELDDLQIKAALKVIERHAGERTVGEVIREVVEGGDEELPLVAVDAHGVLGDLLSGEADRRLTPVPVPRALRGVLRPYQERGLSWLSFLSGLGLGGILADDMGLGKTVSTLSLLLSEREGIRPGEAVPPDDGTHPVEAAPPDGPPRPGDGTPPDEAPRSGDGTSSGETVPRDEVPRSGDGGPSDGTTHPTGSGHPGQGEHPGQSEHSGQGGRHVLPGRPGPTLLVCPMSLIGNWQKEASRFAPSLRVYVHHGGARRREAELAATVREADLVVTTYGTALRDLGALAAIRWERVVCDEAQAIKNSATRQSRAVRSIPARTRLALTGTPVENRLTELWSIMEFCNPGLLGPARRFRTRYQEPIETRRDPDAVSALRRATGPFVLRRLKTDRSIISDLPEKQEMKVWCTLTREQAELYGAVAGEMLGRIDGSSGIERRGNVLAAMTRLKQICNHPVQFLKDGSGLAGRSGKLARLEELAEEIVAEGDKALVFTQYAEFGTLLQPYLAAHLDRPVLWLHGGLSKKRRDALVERFQGDDEPMLFLLSLKAAGTGLNLTAASHVVHVDRWWNPAVEDQATDRAFRIGQTKNVQVRKFICLDTLEERIDEMIERKKSLAQSVVGTGEDWIAGLSTERLRELFRLGPRAVS
ncbi:SNF2-related protein [Streptosporangium sp. DT93]|uniref:SNF2-related protein n=1 Tax=Streptosporangium sp. DT93 TaxID=3393428 RepID=UPI003CF81AEB